MSRKTMFRRGVRATLAAALALALAAPAAAEPGLRSSFRVSDQRQLLGSVEGQAGPVFGGISGATLADPARIGALSVFAGWRPDLARGQIELRLVRPMAEVDGPAAFSLDLNRPIGARFAFGAHLDGDETIARGRARASLVVAPRTRVLAEIGRELPVAGELRESFSLSAARTFDAGGSLAFTLTEAGDDVSRAALALTLRF